MKVLDSIEARQAQQDAIDLWETAMHNAFDAHAKKDATAFEFATRTAAFLESFVLIEGVKLAETRARLTRLVGAVA